MSAEQERALFALRSAENIKPDEEKTSSRQKIRRCSGDRRPQRRDDLRAAERAKLDAVKK